MLLSLLLTLTPTSSTRLAGFYGREAQAWLLGQITRHNPGLAEGLHGDSGPKPYTVSSLIVPESGRREEQGELWMVPNQECLLRITSLSPPLSELLLSKVIPNLPETLKLKWSRFKFLRLSQENGWDGQATFEELVHQDGKKRFGPTTTLQFASPTAFRSQGADLALPTPDQVWRSLWWRWNTFAPEEFHIDPLWPEFAASCIVVSSFQLRSMRVSFKKGKRGAATGCTGYTTYHLLPSEHCGEYEPFRPGAAHVLHMLARFALYSGVGHHTTVGLGQTRMISKK